MNWEWLLLLGVVSFVSALVLTPLLRDLSLRYGLMDHPDGLRHSHARAVPRTGGLPVALSYLAPLALLLAIPSSGVAAAFKSHSFDWELPVSALIVLATGLLDDIRGLKPSQKLLGVFIAS